MKKILSNLFVLGLLILTNTCSAFESKRARFGDTEVDWKLQELTTRSNANLNLLNNKFRVFEICVDNKSKESIFLPKLGYLSYIFGSANSKENVLSAYDEIPGKTRWRKFFCYTPLIINFLVSAFSFLFASGVNATSLKFAPFVISLAVLTLGVVPWSFLVWLFSLRHYKKLNKYYKNLECSKPSIRKLDDHGCWSNSPKEIDGMYEVPAGHSFKELVFSPTNSNVTPIFDASLAYCVH